MTWLFDAECDAHRNGWINIFGFQSAYQRSVLAPRLAEIGPVYTFDYWPYFNVDRVQTQYREWDNCYRIGRILRDDTGKFAPDCSG
jgi:hypothetical protein